MRHHLPELEHPENYRCKIFKYDKGHGRLYIHLQNLENKEEKFFYLFHPIHYFSGQLYAGWIGADFSVGTIEEMLEVARRMEQFHHKTDEELLSHRINLCLYKIQLPYDTILILSGGATKNLTSKY